MTKILIVDDDEDILTISKFSLSALPELEVHCVMSGEEAVKESARLLPDLILLDMMMPKMDGLATLKAIRLIPSCLETPIVFFTAFSQSQDLEKILQLGVIDVIEKPFDPMQFPDIIQKLLAKKDNKR
jgi:two-component system, OmpR family, response regulator